MSELSLDTLTREKVLEHIEFLGDVYEDNLACNSQDRLEIRAETKAIMEWIRLHCGEK